MNILNLDKRGMLQKAISIMLISGIILLAVILLIQAENSTLQNQTNDTENLTLNVSENATVSNSTVNYSNETGVINNTNITGEDQTNINNSVDGNITNHTSSNQTSLNETPQVSPGIPDNASPFSQGDALDTGSIFCQNFTEQVLWSSNYTNDPKGSTNYQTWYPKNNCTSINATDCFLGNIELETRFLYLDDGNKNAQGYVQIAQPNESICNNSQQGIYTRYLSYETVKGESGVNKKLGDYCGDNKNPNSECGIDFSYAYPFYGCYGIKAYADQYMLVDALKINYTLCKNE